MLMSRKPPSDEERVERLGVAEEEPRLERPAVHRHPERGEVRLLGVGHRLVQRVSVHPLPDRESHPAPAGEHPAQLADAGGAVGEELQPLLA